MFTEQLQPLPVLTITKCGRSYLQHVNMENLVKVTLREITLNIVIAWFPQPYYLVPVLKLLLRGSQDERF